MRFDTGTNEFKIRNIPAAAAAAGGRSRSEPSDGDRDAAPGLPGAADKRLAPPPLIRHQVTSQGRELPARFRRSGSGAAIESGALPLASALIPGGL